MFTGVKRGEEEDLIVIQYESIYICLSFLFSSRIFSLISLLKGKEVSFSWIHNICWEWIQFFHSRWKDGRKLWEGETLSPSLSLSLTLSLSLWISHWDREKEENGRREVKETGWVMNEFEELSIFISWPNKNVSFSRSLFLSLSLPLFLIKIIIIRPWL